MIRAPYNFVPLNDKVYIPDWVEQISQDVPFSDGEDGSIEITIKNLSPLFVRNGHTKADFTEWSCHVMEGNKKRFFIPGTTLKGCFRSVLEILSFSKMSNYNEDFFGYRSFTTQVKGADYNSKMKKVNCCGWLYQEDGKFYIDECCRGIAKISHQELRGYFRDFYEGQDHETAEAKQMSIGTKEEPYPIIDTTTRPVDHVTNGSYRVVCTGFMNGKKAEYLFSTQISDKIEVSDNVFRMFNTIHKFTPYYAGEKGKEGFLKGRLMDGRKIPVFFEKSGKDVACMGITRMFRYPYKYSVKENIRRVQNENFDDKMDMPEAIFGHIDSDNPLRGRVQFGHAFCTSLIQDGECPVKEGVFGQPRSSYFPLYLQQSGGEIYNYNFNIPIAGRKRYRIVKDHQVIKPSIGNGNENTITTFRPLPPNKTFRCSVKVHNLRKAEIGALISAITFHGNSFQGALHNLGLAKAYGYGCVSCNIAALNGLKHSVAEYLTAFEDEIESYMHSTYQVGFSMQGNDALLMLVKIAMATHSKEEMEHMALGEFEQYKESRNYSTLQEPNNIELLSMENVKKQLEKQRAALLYEEISRNDQTKDNKTIESIKSQIEKLEFVRQTFEETDLDITEICGRLSELQTLLSVLENPTQLNAGDKCSAVCVASKKVRLDGYDYDIQLTVPKGTDTDSLVGKQMEVEIKQISKVGKIVQVGLLDIK